MKTKIGDKIIFYKITEGNKKTKDAAGPAVYVEREWGGETFNVYRGNIRLSNYPKKHWEISNGWNLYKNLNLKDAMKAAKQALRWL